MLVPLAGIWHSKPVMHWNLAVQATNALFRHCPAAVSHPAAPQHDVPETQAVLMGAQHVPVVDVPAMAHVRVAPQHLLPELHGLSSGTQHTP